MDVRCERCDAEYQFDESLLDERGTTVKCSACGHVFRVSAPVPQRGAALKLRHAFDGRVERLASLRDLQQRIRAGELGLDDELGRDGLAFRRLGDIPELRNFFANLAPIVNPSDHFKPRVDTVRWPNALSVSQSSMPAPPRNPSSHASRTIQGLGPEPEADEARYPEPERVDGTSPTDPAPSAKPRVPMKAGPSNPVKQLYLDDDELPPGRVSPGSSRAWIILGLGGAIALGSALIVPALRDKTAAVPVPAAPRVEAPAVPPSVAPAAPEQPAPDASTDTLGTKPAADVPKSPLAPKDEAAPAASETEPEAALDKRAGKKKAQKAASVDSPAGARGDYGSFIAAGDTALARGDASDAEKAYRAALALRSSGSEANSGLGYALLKLGKAREATAHFERATRNGYADAYIGLGDAHKALGDQAAAQKAYQTYLDRLPDGARAAYAKTQLKQPAAGSKKPSRQRKAKRQNTDTAGAPAEEPVKEPVEEPGGSGEYRPAGELVEPEPSPESPAGGAP